MGCKFYGQDLMNPYYDPAEIVRLANKAGTLQVQSGTRKLLQNLQTQYEKFYQRENISIEDVSKGLGTSLMPDTANPRNRPM